MSVKSVISETSGEGALPACPQAAPPSHVLWMLGDFILTVSSVQRYQETPGGVEEANNLHGGGPGGVQNHLQQDTNALRLFSSGALSSSQRKASSQSLETPWRMSGRCMTSLAGSVVV